MPSGGAQIDPQRPTWCQNGAEIDQRDATNAICGRFALEPFVRLGRDDRCMSGTRTVFSAPYKILNGTILDEREQNGVGLALLQLSSRIPFSYRPAMESHRAKRMLGQRLNCT